MFAIEIDGEPAGRDEVFPGWDANDRLGVIVGEPLGALGASLVIQLSIIAFYDFRPERRGQSIQYPEIYLFHLGASHGDHSYFDFWPERKEVTVENDARAVLTAVNDRAITRLVVVDGDPIPVHHRFAEVAPARDRIRTAFAYNPSGRVTDGDLVISGLDAGTEINATMTLDPERALAGTTSVPPDDGRAEERAIWRERFSRRMSELSPTARHNANTRREAVRTNGCASESYRRIPVDAALNMLTVAPQPDARVTELAAAPSGG
jgi:hypothetical protein